ncbi:hypothetical protein M9458_052371, partial [Cirrhinus mrigala]
IDGWTFQIHALRSDVGTLLSEPSDIRKRALSEEANAELSYGLTLEEFEKALRSKECGKAPGVDGLSIDFYKSFWSEMALDL